MHVGGIDSIMPPQVITNGEDNTRSMLIHQNKLQNLFYNEWLKMCGQGHFDAVFSLGDMCDGLNPAESGAGEWTNDIDCQVDTAVSLLGMIDTDKFYGIQGSPYHTKLNCSADQLIIEKLGGQFDDVMTVQVEGITFYLKHVVGVSKLMHTRATSMNRDMVNSELGSYTNGKIDVHLRGHAHYYCYTELNFDTYVSRGMVLPCWKATDSFLKRGDLMVNDCGYVIATIDENNITFEPHLFKIPVEYNKQVIQV
jgi:hypothetical protein